MMTYKVFCDWANLRAMDGAWPAMDAIITLNIAKVMNAIPRRKREKAWKAMVTLLGCKNDVPPISVGQTVCMLLEDTDKETDPISVEVITEVGTRGFWLSGFTPSRDDMSVFVPWEDVGTRAFFSRYSAEAALQAKEDERNGMD